MFTFIVRSSVLTLKNIDIFIYSIRFFISRPEYQPINPFPVAQNRFITELFQVRRMKRRNIVDDDDDDDGLTIKANLYWWHKCPQMLIHWEIAHWFALMEAECVRVSVSIKVALTASQSIQFKGTRWEQEKAGGVAMVTQQYTIEWNWTKRAVELSEQEVKSSERVVFYIERHVIVSTILQFVGILWSPMGIVNRYAFNSIARFQKFESNLSHWFAEKRKRVSEKKKIS